MLRVEAWTLGEDNAQQGRIRIQNIVTFCDTKIAGYFMDLHLWFCRCTRVRIIMSSAETPDHDALIAELSNLTSITPQEVGPRLLPSYSLAMNVILNKHIGSAVPRSKSVGPFKCRYRVLHLTRGSWEPGGNFRRQREPTRHTSRPPWSTHSQRRPNTSTHPDYIQHASSSFSRRKAAA